MSQRACGTRAPRGLPWRAPRVAQPRVLLDAPRRVSSLWSRGAVCRGLALRCLVGLLELL